MDDGKTVEVSRTDISFEKFARSVCGEGILSEDRKTLYPSRRIFDVKDVTPEYVHPFQALSSEGQEAMDRARHREHHTED
jgi:hypothetical protein